MARKVKFPLKMADGANVRTIEELKEHFDFQSVLGYYTSGKLLIWLNDRYCETEVEKISNLPSADSPDFKKLLCDVFDILVEEDVAEEVDLDYITKCNEKKQALLELTSNAELIKNVDSVALNQEDLIDCLDRGIKKIYLVGKVFRVPVSVSNMEYVGINGAVAIIRAMDNINFKKQNIKFTNMYFVWDSSLVTPADRCWQAEQCFLKGKIEKAYNILNSSYGGGILGDNVSSINPKAIIMSYLTYKINRYLLDDETYISYFLNMLSESELLNDWQYYSLKEMSSACSAPDECENILEWMALRGNLGDKLLHWFLTGSLCPLNATEQKYFLAKYIMGIDYLLQENYPRACDCFLCLQEESELREKIFEMLSYENMIKQVQYMAEQGNASAQYALSIFLEKNGEEEKSMEWLLKSSNQGYAQAKYHLGMKYYYDDEDKKRI